MRSESVLDLWDSQVGRAGLARRSREARNGTENGFALPKRGGGRCRHRSVSRHDRRHVANVGRHSVGGNRGGGSELVYSLLEVVCLAMGADSHRLGPHAS